MQQASPHQQNKIQQTDRAVQTSVVQKDCSKISDRFIISHKLGQGTFSKYTQIT